MSFFRGIACPHLNESARGEAEVGVKQLARQVKEKTGQKVELV